MPPIPSSARIPINPRVDYAYYIKGLVDFERTPNLFERAFHADLTKRPPSTARKSFDSFRHVVQQYPKSPYAHDALQRMIYLRNRLADYDVHVAEYYMQRGAYIGASQRAAAEHPGVRRCAGDAGGPEDPDRGE